MSFSPFNSSRHPTVNSHSDRLHGAALLAMHPGVTSKRRRGDNVICVTYRVTWPTRRYTSTQPPPTRRRGWRIHPKTLRHVGLAYRMPRVPHCPPPLLLLHYSTRMIYVFVKLRRFLGDSQQPPAAASHGESRFYGFSQSTRLYIHSSQSACVREGRGTHFVVRGAAPGALCASSIWVCPSSTNSSAENISLRLYTVASEIGCGF